MQLVQRVAFVIQSKQGKLHFKHLFSDKYELIMQLVQFTLDEQY